MKNFDIRLNNRLTEYDLIIYCLAFYDFLKASNPIVLDCLSRFAAKINFDADSVIKSDVAIDKTQKTTFEGPQDIIASECSLETIQQQYFERAADSIDALSVLKDLLYQNYCDGESNADLDVSVVDTDTARTLGRSDFELFVSANLTGNGNAQKHISADVPVRSEAEIFESIQSDLKPDASSIKPLQDVSFTVRRYRTLGELDTETFESIDDMTLEDIDFVIL